MKKIKVAINGFGRIGRAFFKIARENPDIEIVAVNDLGDIKNMAYLLKYDSVYGTSPFDVKVEEGAIPSFLIGEDRTLVVSKKEISELPWRELGVDIVVESTGLFTDYEKAKAHIAAGAKRVVISAPMKGGPDGNTVLMGVNEEGLEKADVSSNASCTTNAGSPIISILNDTIGIEKAVLNTVHSYTASQGIVDGPNKKDFREGRAAAMNIVPSSTGAAIATTKAITSLKDKFDGISVRVPTVVGSVVDITFIAKRETSKEEINKVLKEAAATDRWKGIFAVTEEDLVSRDIVGSPYASIADLAFTRVVGGNLVKVLAWYDNEMGYTHTLLRHVLESAKYI